MHSVIVITLAALTAQTHAEDTRDDLVENAANKLYARLLKVWSVQDDNLDHTTLGKPGQVAMSAGQNAMAASSPHLRSQSRAQIAPGITSLPRYMVPIQLNSVATMAERKFFVGGNWKANGTPDKVKTLVKELNDGRVTATDVEVVCAPPFVYLADVKNNLRSDYSVAAQNLWDKAPGAWTGEIPAEMLVSMGIGWVILGHSERRENCGETSQIVADKTKFAIDKGLNSITCIGEKLDAREGGTTFQVLDEQMKPLAATLTGADWEKVVLAYEPVWAIGTGKVATPDQAEETHAFLRKWLKDNVSQKVSDELRILYGGSVNDKNSAELAGKPNIDGFLVGGASLQGGPFTAIVNSAKPSAIGV